MSDFDNYMGRLRKQDKSPNDAFAHAHSLMVPSDKKKPSDMHKLVDKDMMLGNIDNDELLQLYQAEIHSLTYLASMAENDPELIPFFDMKYAALRGELGLTRAHKGKERDSQDGFGRQGSIMPGYGSTLEYGDHQEEGLGKGLGGLAPSLPKPNADMWK